VNEPLELQKNDESLPELTALLSVENSPLEPVVPSWMRLAYAVEFLVALIAVLNVWSEVGGQGHLDLMPWYIKLTCLGGMAWCLVRFTAGMVEQKQVWTRRTVAWFAAILLIGIAMGGITYYYHLHEPSDDDPDATAAAVRLPSLGLFE